MLEYMILPYRRYAQFQGRARRMEYWSFTLFNVLVYAVIVAAAMFMGLSVAALSELEAGDPSLLFGSGFFVLIGLAGVFWLVSFLPSIALNVRRLHDRDMSGWWYLGFFVLSIVPFVNWIVSIAYLVVMVLPGTTGTNRYGLDPKDPTGAEIFV